MVTPLFLTALGEAMGAVYRDCVERILENIARHFQYVQPGDDPGGSFEYQIRKLAEMGQLTSESIRIINNMMGGADTSLKDCLEAAIRDALADLEPELRNAAMHGLLNGGIIPPMVDPRMTSAFAMYYQQAADRLNLVNTVMLESTENAYRATVSNIVARMQTTQRILNTAAGQLVSGVDSFNNIQRIAVNKMLDNGITGFIDHDGRRWRPETYVAMDMRTTFHNTARQAFFDKNEEYANDLYLVSQHPGARPLCYPWQCKVISRANLHRWVTDGDGKPVQVWAQNETSYGEPAGLFGINCGHHPMLFIPGASKVPDLMQDEEANAETYADSQQQRALERGIREAQLKAKVARTRHDPEQLKQARQEREKLDKKLQELLDRTGRKRRAEREYTPVDAKWADPDEFGTSPTAIRDMINDYFRTRR